MQKKTRNDIIMFKWWVPWVILLVGLILLPLPVKIAHVMHALQPGQSHSTFYVLFKNFFEYFVALVMFGFPFIVYAFLILMASSIHRSEDSYALQSGLAAMLVVPAVFIYFFLGANYHPGDVESGLAVAIVWGIHFVAAVILGIVSICAAIGGRSKKRSSGNKQGGVQQSTNLPPQSAQIKAAGPQQATKQAAAKPTHAAQPASTQTLPVNKPRP